MGYHIMFACMYRLCWYLLKHTSVLSFRGKFLILIITYAWCVYGVGTSEESIVDLVLSFHLYVG